KKNFDNLDSDENIKVYTYKAQFKDNETVDLLNKSNEIVESIQADHIIINTGSRSNIPEIEAIEQTENIYDSKGIMELRHLPEHLVMVCGGYISLEFATIFTSHGRKVSMIHNRRHIVGTEDKDVASHIYEQSLIQGTEFIDEADIHAFSTEDKRPVAHTNKGD